MPISRTDGRKSRQTDGPTLIKSYAEIIQKYVALSKRMRLYIVSVCMGVVWLRAMRAAEVAVFMRHNKRYCGERVSPRKNGREQKSDKHKSVIAVAV